MDKAVWFAKRWYWAVAGWSGWFGDESAHEQPNKYQVNKNINEIVSSHLILDGSYRSSYNIQRHTHTQFMIGQWKWVRSRCVRLFEASVQSQAHRNGRNRFEYIYFVSFAVVVVVSFYDRCVASNICSFQVIFASRLHWSSDLKISTASQKRASMKEEMGSHFISICRIVNIISDEFVSVREKERAKHEIWNRNREIN